MLFNSYIFILLFLPLCLAGYFYLQENKRDLAAKVWLTGMSLWFYAYFNPYYLLIILASIGVNFAVYRLITRAVDRICEGGNGSRRGGQSRNFILF